MLTKANADCTGLIVLSGLAAVQLLHSSLLADSCSLHSPPQNLND